MGESQSPLSEESCSSAPNRRHSFRDFLAQPDNTELQQSSLEVTNAHTNFFCVFYDKMYQIFAFCKQKKGV